MIDPALLDRLREADPETWKRFSVGMASMGPRFFNRGNLTYDNEEIRTHKFEAAYIPVGQMPVEFVEAWLQHVLQETIAKKKWVWDIGVPMMPPHGYIGIIQKNLDDNLVKVKARSPTEALLHAYLKAIKD
jgi:hypothetical protein